MMAMTKRRVAMMMTMTKKRRTRNVLKDLPSQNVWTDFQHRRLWQTQGLGLPLPGGDDDGDDYDDCDDVDEDGACGQPKD